MRLGGLKVFQLSRIGFLFSEREALIIVLELFQWNSLLYCYLLNFTLPCNITSLAPWDVFPSQDVILQ